ncbi:MAG: hypothetical protein QXS90_02210, partial [Candidatus Diapherotrites archaeon]
MRLTIIRKILVLIITGILPLLVFVLASTYGLDLFFSLVLGGVFAVVFALFLHFFVFNHPLIRVIEGAGLP